MCQANLLSETIWVKGRLLPFFPPLFHPLQPCKKHSASAPFAAFIPVQPSCTEYPTQHLCSLMTHPLQVASPKASPALLLSTPQLKTHCLSHLICISYQTRLETLQHSLVLGDFQCTKSSWPQMALDGGQPPVLKMREKTFYLLCWFLQRGTQHGD